MVRLVVRLVVAVLANAVGLIVAALVLDDMALSASGFLLALIVADVVSDGVSISGFVTWLLATVIVWAVVLLAGLLLPATIFKRWLRERR